MFYAMFALIVLSFNIFKIDYNIEDFEKLYKLVGTWTMPYKEGELVEKWQKQYNKKLTGETFYINGNSREVQEKIDLFLTDGRIYYSSNVNGQNDGEPVPFSLIGIEKNKFIFENKEHDFPQRIIYDLRSPTELVASIEGDTKDGFKKIVYKYKKKVD
ncbi:MAG: DUF6265 family protein [Ignavibacteria bacterium]